jgi:hypothetical protein
LASATPEQPTPASTQQLFWAREFVKLAREHASAKGVPDHAIAQAMMVQAWTLFTGQNEDDARKTVSGIYSRSIAKQQHHERSGATA